MNDHAKGLVSPRERLRRSIFYEIGKNRARIRFLSRVLFLGLPLIIVIDYLGFFRDSNSQLFGDYSIYLLGINDYLGGKK